MNGLCIAWGEVSTGNDQNKTFNIGLTFSSSTSYTVSLTQIWPNGSSQYNANLYLISKTASTLTIRGQNTSASYICIGY